MQQDGAEFKSDVGFYADTCDKDGKNCLVTELNEGERARASALVLQLVYFVPRVVMQSLIACARELCVRLYTCVIFLPIVSQFTGQSLSGAFLSQTQRKSFY